MVTVGDTIEAEGNGDYQRVKLHNNGSGGTQQLH